MKAAQTAASSSKGTACHRASSEGEIDAAFATMAEQRVSASCATTRFIWAAQQIASLAAQYRIPAIYYLPEFAEAGGLMAYGNRITEAYRHVGIYVGRILKGEKPADLPVVQATAYEFVINLKTAKALGLTIPPGVISFADAGIE
jgi:putative ABC transport system substrate-binding protein